MLQKEKEIKEKRKKVENACKKNLWDQSICVHIKEEISSKHKRAYSIHGVAADYYQLLWCSQDKDSLL